uniref:Uncharacterized protein n=1 Tax=Onchocerca volvulus TaxID=6282 RepID=A0A8R1TJQ1_ONCVO
MKTFIGVQCPDDTKSLRRVTRNSPMASPVFSINSLYSSGNYSFVLFEINLWEIIGIYRILQASFSDSSPHYPQPSFGAASNSASCKSSARTRALLIKKKEKQKERNREEEENIWIRMSISLMNWRGNGERGRGGVKRGTESKRKGRYYRDRGGSSLCSIEKECIAECGKAASRRCGGARGCIGQLST